MNIEEAILARHSVRQYTGQKIEEEKISALSALTEEINKESGLNIQLVTNEPKAFSQGLAKYGKFSGINDYFAMVCKKGFETLLGYYGQKLVLNAQMLGLNTCWVGLTFKNQPDKYTINSGEKLAAIVALGYGKTQGRPHPQKNGIENYCHVEGQMPEWFKRGMEFALLAPTALNQQKFMFTLSGSNKVKAETKFALLNNYPPLDLGIVKCQFEIGAGKDNFVWEE